MPKKNKPQQYFYLRHQVGRNLNRLETELDNFLYREDRTVFNNQQELSRWLEQLGQHCRLLSGVHKRSAPAELLKITDSDQRLTYKLTERLSITIYKSKL